MVTHLLGEAYWRGLGLVAHFEALEAQEQEKEALSDRGGLMPLSLLALALTYERSVQAVASD